MSFWEILGIDSTDNVSVIKKAYAKKLKMYHPEDDPEGYQRLREAYDSAVKYLKNNKKKQTAEHIDNSKNEKIMISKLNSIEDTLEDDVHVPPPINILDGLVEKSFSFEETVEEFINEVQILYNNFFSRINIENWVALLNSQVMWYMGNKEFLSNKMIEFLMENHYLPQNIWKLLESNFNWSEQKEYLYKKYPEEFIDYLFKQINGPSKLRYCCFKEIQGVDYEAFLKYREKAFDALSNNDFLCAQEYIDNAYNIYPNDPDLLLMQGKCYLHNENIDKALTVFENLIQKDSEDIYARYYRAKILYDKRQMHSALDDCNYIQSHMLDNLDFLSLFAKCCFKLEEFHKAKELLLELLNINPLDNEARALLEQINLQLVYKLKEKKGNKQVKIELDKLYEELGKLGKKQIIGKLLWIMLKRFFICWLIFIIQVATIRVSMRALGFSDATSIKNIEKFIMAKNEVHLIKNSEDINKLSLELSTVEGKITDAGFLDLYRIPTSAKDNNPTTLYLSLEEAKKQNLFDKMDGYICIGTLGDKKVIIIVNYEQADQIYKTKSLNFKGIVHCSPPKDLINEVKKRYMSNKFEDEFITDKFIDTNTALSNDRKFIISIVAVLLFVEFLTIIEGVIVGYKLVKANRKF